MQVRLLEAGPSPEQIPPEKTSNERKGTILEVLNKQIRTNTSLNVHFYLYKRPYIFCEDLYLFLRLFED